jgi:hypothetical protein
VAALRDEIAELVDELDRRRREAFDLGLQLRRHPAAAAAAAVVAAVAVGGLVALGVRRRRRRASRLARAREVRRALARLLREPERVGRPPAAIEKLALAAATAAIGALARRLFLERSRPPVARPTRPRERAPRDAAAPLA